MSRRRWLLQTFWGNVLLLPLLCIVMYHAARQDNRWFLALFGVAFTMTVNCACNMAIIAADENEQARAQAATNEGD